MSDSSFCFWGLVRVTAILGDEALALSGYGSPLPLPGNPVDLASLLSDAGGAAADGSGVRLAAALAIGPDGGPSGSGAPLASGSGCNPSVSSSILRFTGCCQEIDADTFTLPSGQVPGSIDGAARLEVRPEILKRAWETTAKQTKDDWTEWMRRLAVELLRESPSPALRACSALAQVRALVHACGSIISCVLKPRWQVYAPLAADLFNAAFVAIWSDR